MNLEDAIKAVRKELLIKDEPWKAYKMLLRFKKEHNVELKTELMKTYTMVQHAYNPEAYKEAYNIPIKDAEIIEPIDVATKAWVRYFRYAWVMDNLKKEDAKTFMDMGCYVGSLVTTAASFGIQSYGVDFTEKVIELARKRAKKVGVEDKTKFFVADVTEFDDQKAEHVSSLEVIEHVVDPVAYATHLADLASEWVYISTPNGPYGNGEGNLPNWDLRGPTDRRGHLRVFTKDTIVEMLEKLGMEIGEVIEGEDELVHVKYRRKK